MVIRCRAPDVGLGGTEFQFTVALVCCNIDVHYNCCNVMVYLLGLPEYPNVVKNGEIGYISYLYLNLKQKPRITHHITTFDNLGMYHCHGDHSDIM